MGRVREGDKEGGERQEANTTHWKRLDEQSSPLWKQPGTVIGLMKVFMRRGDSHLLTNVAIPPVCTFPFNDTSTDCKHGRSDGNQNLETGSFCFVFYFLIDWTVRHDWETYKPSLKGLQRKWRLKKKQTKQTSSVTCCVFFFFFLHSFHLGSGRWESADGHPPDRVGKNRQAGGVTEWQDGAHDNMLPWRQLVMVWFTRNTLTYTAYIFFFFSISVDN